MLELEEEFSQLRKYKRQILRLIDEYNDKKHEDTVFYLRQALDEINERIQAISSR